MADFGRTDEFAPDSTLLSDLNNSVIVNIEGERNVLVAKNDWLDLDKRALPQDPYWGYSYQVSKIDNDIVYIKTYDQSLDTYYETALSPSYILNVYRLVEEKI